MEQGQADLPNDHIFLISVTKGDRSANANYPGHITVTLAPNAKGKLENVSTALAKLYPRVDHASHYDLTINIGITDKYDPFEVIKDVMDVLHAHQLVKIDEVPEILAKLGVETDVKIGGKSKNAHVR